jgi:hypothetical protein
MKRIDPEKMSRADLDRLGTEAEEVTRGNTRPLTPAAPSPAPPPKEAARALGPGQGASTSRLSKPCSPRPTPTRAAMG